MIFFWAELHDFVRTKKSIPLFPSAHYAATIENTYTRAGMCTCQKYDSIFCNTPVSGQIVFFSSSSSALQHIHFLHSEQINDAKRRENRTQTKHAAGRAYDSTIHSDEKRGIHESSRIVFGCSIDNNGGRSVGLRLNIECCYLDAERAAKITILMGSSLRNHHR